ncbi:adhesion G-protein coupled receptor F2 [Myripristis murdjan]|uniref:adhesion G-protein coupled receptor F2 n=1 Tax=Myripristis murdjan TaxID=586833 RepID=UPI0011760254|nr:adhesion G-protein coupled receptor F2-like [Myripristis murdjan]
MWARCLIFLAGAVFIHGQNATADVTIAELMVTSNVSLAAKTVLTALSNTSALNSDVTIVELDLVADCLLVGAQTTCSCSAGYVWSNTVCYSTNPPTCCNDTACNQNVSHLTPLCIPKEKVSMSGSVTLRSGPWQDSHKTQVMNALKTINGFLGLNISMDKSTTNFIERMEDNSNIAHFEADFNVKFETSKLQDFVADLETTLGATVLVETLGLVTISAPKTKVCYKSNPTMNCNLEEATNSSGWRLTSKDEKDTFKLNDGSVVTIDNSCATSEYKSCVSLKLNGITGRWAGTYVCGFTTGSINHIAKTELDVVLLPDEITMSTNPLTADCTKVEPTSMVTVEVTATILNSSESYRHHWKYTDEETSQQGPIYKTKSDKVELHYSAQVKVNCIPTKEAHRVSITFTNSKNQRKNATVDIPVIYANEKFCEKDGDEWPKTPDGDTVINRICGEGRTGYKERTCKGKEWQSVFDNCVKEKLYLVLKKAEKFQEGLVANPEEVLYIFSGLSNISAEINSSIADVSASINVLAVMANASKLNPFQEDVVPAFLGGASSMVNQSWDGINTTIKGSMAANYLQSVENLVKNIEMNATKGHMTENLDLKISSTPDNVTSVFNISVAMHMTSGIIKMVSVKKLTEKLGSLKDKRPSELLVSVTVQNSSNSSTSITLDFPKDEVDHNKVTCVFWDTTDNVWSNEGCRVNKSDDGRITCQCDHLTSFSVLMSKKPVELPFLKEITYVGLGVSICSLLVLLIIEALVWSAVVKTNLSHFRHTALVNISLCLFLADCSFIASSFPEILNGTSCLILTVCKHFFFLSMFGWAMSLSIMLVHQLIFVFNPLRKRVFMFFSSIVGYVCPVIIVGTSYVYYKYTGSPYHSDKCWLIFDGLLKGSMHAFLIPVGIVLMTNVFSMVVVILTLMKSSSPDSSKAEDKDTAKSILKVVVFLTPVFGITWILGFLQLFLSDAGPPLFEIIHYSFTILNSFQGFFIFLTGCFAEQKVREEVLRLIMAKVPSKEKSESMRKLTSITNSKTNEN